MKQYYLVTDAASAEVERLTGLPGHDTPFGTLVQKPTPFDMHAAMALVNKAINPNPCTCGSWAIIHQPNCPFWRTT